MRHGPKPLAAAAAILLATAAQTAAVAEPRHYMVVAANPHAALAGIEILALGGSAVDAAVAVQAMLGLVEPQSSGLGGGAFMLTYDADTKAVRAFDGRETAPASAGPDLFLGPDGEPMKWPVARLTGRAVGAPGVPALLWKAHQAHGKLDWSQLFDPAIRLARAGFTVSPRLAALVADEQWSEDARAARDYFFVTGADGASRPVVAGDVLRNPAYADVLQAIAEGGPSAFYSGPVAESIVAAVGAASTPGSLGLDDLAGYEAKERAPVCRPYRSYRVCGMPPPTSGGVTTLQILGLLERFDLAALDPGSLEEVHLEAEAGRLAFADRNLYLADPDFVEQPVEGLLADDYLKARGAAIDSGKSMGKAAAGEPAGRRGDLEPGEDRSLPSTSHFAIVDADGNAISVTTSIESAFGSHLMASGFLLNNQLTDFSFRAEADGAPVANRVEGGKRPRSSMSPMIVLDRNGNFVAALGSPGGSRIIGYVAQALIAILDHGLTMQAAFDLPHHVNRNGPTDLEQGTDLEMLAPGLEALGHKVSTVAMTSGLHGIMVRDGRLDGGADKRREGVVLEGTAR